MKILFMGTPDFAVASLKALCDGGFEIAGAVTREDRQQGRGYKLTPPPVKKFALERGIPVFQPATIRDTAFGELLEKLNPDLIAVAAFGRILPHSVIEYPDFGCVNVHGSLLPEYRGAAPIQRAMIDGKTFTGVTTMMMDDGLDTGDILLTEKVLIGPEDDFLTVHDRMAEAGGKLLVRTVRGLLDGTVSRIPQDSVPIIPTYASKIEKSECAVDFTEEAWRIHNLIRGLSPAPLAFTRMPGGKLLKLVSSKVGLSSDSETPGKVVSADGDGFTVACGPDGRDRLIITAVLPEGKGRMSAADFIRGRRITAGDFLG